MSPILIGIVALGVAVLGLIVHTWRFVATRSISYGALWIMAPLVGAVVAFLVAPQNLLTISLGGASLALALVTLAATLVVPALTDERAAAAESRRESQGRAA
jgi:hypothetical protein